MREPILRGESLKVNEHDAIAQTESPGREDKAGQPGATAEGPHGHPELSGVV
jgi:hypothetical protein